MCIGRGVGDLWDRWMHLELETADGSKLDSELQATAGLVMERALVRRRLNVPYSTCMCVTSWLCVAELCWQVRRLVPVFIIHCCCPTVSEVRRPRGEGDDQTPCWAGPWSGAVRLSDELYCHQVGVTETGSRTRALPDITDVTANSSKTVDDGLSRRYDRSLVTDEVGRRCEKRSIWEAQMRSHK